VGFLRSIEFFLGSKKLSGDPKNQEIDFLKKPKFCDLSEHGGGQGSGPSHPDGVGALGLG